MAVLADPPRSARRTARSGRERAGALLACAAIAIAAAVALVAGAGRPADIRTWTFPSGLETVTAAGGGLWVTEPGRRRAARLDPADGRVTATVRADGSLRVAGGEVWLVDPHAARLAQLDATTGRPLRAVALDTSDGDSYKGFDAFPAGGAVWVVGFAGARVLDRGDLRPRAVVPVRRGDVEPALWAPLGDAVWMVRRDGTAERYDAATGRRTLAAPPAGQGVPRQLLASDRGLVVVNADGLLVARDPRSGRPRWRTRVPAPVGAAALAGDRLVVQAPDPTAPHDELIVLSLRTGRPVARRDVPAFGSLGLAVYHEQAWSSAPGGRLTAVRLP